MTPRTSDEKKVEQLQSQLLAAKARLNKQKRQRRTAELIALGVLLSKVLLRPNMPLDWWRKAADELLAPGGREHNIVTAALAEIAQKRGGSS